MKDGSALDEMEADFPMFTDLIRTANREIVEFLACVARSEAGQPSVPSIRAESLHGLCKRLAEVGEFFTPSFFEETRKRPEIGEYERNLGDLKALLERAQVNLTAHRESLRSQLAKLRSASAWARTFDQTL